MAHRRGCDEEADEIKEALEGVKNVSRQAEGLMEIWPDKVARLHCQAMETIQPFAATIQKNHNHFVSWEPDENEDDQ